MADKNLGRRRSRGPVVVCSGFHRSATSLTAQLMHVGGLNMGRRLVAPHLSNPDGHFEDIDVVNVNDQLLGMVGSDWRFHDEAPLPTNEISVSLLQPYLAKRDEAHAKSGWGVKDPRISLFLPLWDDLLEERGHFVLLVRHWGGSIQSLFNRHSRVLVEQGTGAGLNPKDEHLSFWAQPGLAARMWIAYNRRILEFAQSTRDRTLILPQPLLVDGRFNLIEWMNDNWGTKLKVPPSGVVKPHLLTERLDPVIDEMVTPILRSQMDKIWRELLDVSCARLGGKSDAGLFQPDWSKQSKKDTMLDAAISRVQDLIPHIGPVSNGVNLDHVMRARDNRTVANVLELLEYSPFLPFPILSDLFIWIEANAPDDAVCWHGFGVRALKEDRMELAERAFLRAAATGRAPASLWFHLGKLYERQHLYTRAEYYYREAIRHDRKDHSFITALAQLLIKQYRTDEALKLLDGQVSRFGSPSLATLWVNLMIELGRHDEAAARVSTLLEAFPEYSVEWTRIQATLELPSNARSATESLNQVLRNGLNIEDLPLMLARVLWYVDSDVAFRDLARRMLKHWRSMFSEREIKDAFRIKNA